MRSSNSDELVEGYEKALALLNECATPDGFVASPSEHDNYHRIWGRDGTIMSLAALLTGNHQLIETARQTFATLAKYQGPHGEIPSNIETAADRISFGGTTGRVDTDLWFIIGCGEYWLATGDDSFLDQLLPVIEKVRFLLGAWEMNNRGLIYVPLAGDWADEYLQNGYVLYDQLLYLQAQRTLSRMHTAVHGSSDHLLNERTSRLRHLIRANYWFDESEKPPDDVYHEVLYQQGLAAAKSHCAGQHWMPFFSPAGYGYRFDAFANVLASLFDVADDSQSSSVDSYIADELINNKLPLLPAFHPVIQPADEDWEELHVMFSYTFKNNPYEYHNGGLWPMITGFYVADLARRQQTGLAKSHLLAIHRANALAMEGEAWGFPEFVHGKKLTPGGTRHQGWSAAAAIIGHHAVNGKSVFRINDDDSGNH